MAQQLTTHFLLYLGQYQQASGILVVPSASGARQEVEEFMSSKRGASIVVDSQDKHNL